MQSQIEECLIIKENQAVKSKLIVKKVFVKIFSTPQTSIFAVPRALVLA